MTRLDALETLRWLDVAVYPHASPEGAQGIVRRLCQAAGLPVPGAARGDEYDADGRLVLRGSGAVRQWLGSFGMAA